MKLERDQFQKLAAERLIVSKLGLERFSSDNELIKFYTGFPTYKHILFFYEFVKPSAENMVYCYATRAQENRRSTHTMHIIDEIGLCSLFGLSWGFLESENLLSSPTVVTESAIVILKRSR